MSRQRVTRLPEPGYYRSAGLKDAIAAAGATARQQSGDLCGYRRLVRPALARIGPHVLAHCPACCQNRHGRRSTQPDTRVRRNAHGDDGAQNPGHSRRERCTCPHGTHSDGCCQERVGRCIHDDGPARDSCLVLHSSSFASTRSTVLPATCNCLPNLIRRLCSWYAALLSPRLSEHNERLTLCGRFAVSTLPYVPPVVLPA